MGRFLMDSRYEYYDANWNKNQNSEKVIRFNT